MKVCFLQALMSLGLHAMSQAKGTLTDSSEPYKFSIPLKGFQDGFCCTHFPMKAISVPLCMVQNIRLLGSCFQTNHGSHFI